MLVSEKLDCCKCGDFITFVLRTVFVDELGNADTRLDVIGPTMISSSNVSSDPNTRLLCPYQDSADAYGCHLFCPRTVSRPLINVVMPKQTFQINIPLLNTKTFAYSFLHTMTKLFTKSYYFHSWRKFRTRIELLATIIGKWDVAEGMKENSFQLSVALLLFFPLSKWKWSSDMHYWHYWCSITYQFPPNNKWARA